MKRIRELIEKQITFQKKIKESGINLVTCKKCGSVNFIETRQSKFVCYGCLSIENARDCLDFFYPGIENNDKFNGEEMETVFECMKMKDGDYEIKTNGLLIKAKNIFTGKEKWGGFKKDINDIIGAEKADISFYCTGSYFNEITERDVILENSLIQWFDEIKFTKLQEEEVEERWGTKISELKSIDEISNEIENQMKKSLFYISHNQDDVIEAVKEEWEVTRPLTTRRRKKSNPLGKEVKTGS